MSGFVECYPVEGLRMNRINLQTEQALKLGQRLGMPQSPARLLLRPRF
jgi:hypothetical protein